MKMRVLLSVACYSFILWAGRAGIAQSTPLRLAPHTWVIDLTPQPVFFTEPSIAIDAHDGGQRFANYAWTTQPFNPRRAFLGDYTGIAARDGHLYGIWTTKPAAGRGPQIQIGSAWFDRQH